MLHKNGIDFGNNISNNNNYRLICIYIVVHIDLIFIVIRLMHVIYIGTGLFDRYKL